MARLSTTQHAAMDALYGMPGHLIRRAQQISTALFTEECASFDLTAVQFAAMMAIRAHPNVDATRLSRLIAFDRSTLGNVLERLEAKDWISRSEAVADRRVKLLRITLEGERLLHQVEPAVQRVQQRMLAPLADADRAALLRLLGQLAELHNDVTPVPLQVAARD